jgi:hypothetical protein
LPAENLRTAIAGLVAPAVAQERPRAAADVAEVVTALLIVAHALQADPGLLTRLTLADG